MEALEEAMGSKEYLQIIKRKRTKRQRSASPIGISMASTSCITAEGSGSGGGGGGGGFSDNSGELEEDMANCLILLAQGQTHKLSEPTMYECKTCNRCFPSFQALGGHRASHKKPKPTLEGKKTLVLTEKEDDNSTTTTLSLQISNGGLCSTNNKARVHECSICGAEFRSGQALGGHMRRHRTIPMATTTSTSLNTEPQEGMKARNLLSLDLNLPAPEDDHRQQLIVFSSASSLVDCHY